MMRSIHALLATTLLTVACGADPMFEGDVPTNPDALLPWLEAGSYQSWFAEPQIHPTSAPHGTHARTYLNTPLAGSLENGNATHVEHSAAVKEIYDVGFVVGWAVMVKTETTDRADAWYFYEILDRKERDQIFEGQGLNLCADCHTAGQDHIRTPWPQ